MRTGLQHTQVERALRDIEHRVLEEVWISGTRRVAAAVAATALGIAAVLHWWGTNAAEHPAVIPHVTTVILLLAWMVSVLALCMRRFRWCCAAVCTSWVSTVTSVGALWWRQTAQASYPLVWITVGCLAAVVLTTVWFGVILTPLDRSQPDMRKLHHQPVTGEDRNVYP
ncbi:hypothetical protein [Mycolicibacterium elephantis]|uniref:Transmembrane protein n=1 Tax=Mycolicibacterium elephantis DSM 44368 TaxID=1335622 RepID=A0A439DUE0_9MYCO|nr:hypothetical protein [Mycolicibacterium elephantis]MCV7220986.1 hypothetical protein [Mycolicibacterium elephantis]RWA20219.1 hypothetical protein MELE44368_18655 [Mycolicibacterium elephantis DSM 44368]